MEWLLYFILILLFLFLFPFLFIMYSDCNLILFSYDKMRPNLHKIKGKVVWITGASSGNGEILAYTLAKLGAKLVLSARRETELHRVLEKCQSLSPEEYKRSHMIMVLDILQYDKHSSCVEQVINHYGKIDYLINNAGCSQRAVAMDTKLEVHKFLLDTNFLGTVSLSTAVLPYMVKERDGCIVVVSSLSGKIDTSLVGILFILICFMLGTPGLAGYCASKHAIQGYFNSLRTELADTGVSVLLICPGPLYTGTSRKLLGSTLKKEDQLIDVGSPTDTMKVSSKRCTHLIAVTMTNKLNEVWICKNIFLLLLYLTQYIPDLANFVLARKAKGRLQAIKTRKLDKFK